MLKQVRQPPLYTGRHDDGRHTSRVSTGRDLLPNDDGRSRWARLLKSTYRALVVHCGGDDAISDTRRMACRRVAALEAELVFHEDRIASIRRRGKEPPTTLLQMYGTLADRQRRLSEALGWDRDGSNAKDISLTDYIASKAKTKAKNGRHAGGIDHDA